MFCEYNPNPVGRRSDDCTVRAIAKALDMDWETAYLRIAINGFQMGSMPSNNSVWGALLRQNGFYRRVLPDTCPDCYTVRDFCRDYPTGTYVLGLDEHVVTAIDGDWFDIFDSGDETIQYFWYRKDE